MLDPNYPGNADRKIIYYSGEGKFKPYESGANKDEIEKGNSTSYGNIEYNAKSTMVAWDKIAQRWAEFKNKTIGNDKFPAYTLQYKDDKGNWQELKEGYKSPVKLISIQALSGGGPPLGSQVYRDGAALPKGEKELKPGDNLLGIWLIGYIGNDPKYVDFKYINVTFEGAECRINPAQVQGEVNDKYTFTAIMVNPPAKPTYEWYFNGELASTGESKDFTVTFTSAGSHTVSFKVLDEKDNGVGEATAAIEIKAPVEVLQGCRLSYLCTPVSPVISIEGQKDNTCYLGYQPIFRAEIPTTQDAKSIIYKWTIDNGVAVEKKENSGWMGRTSIMTKALGTFKVKVECYCTACPGMKRGEAEFVYQCVPKP